MSNEITTTNLADFGWRERKLAAELLTVSCEQGFPDDFEDEEVIIMFNRNSGSVFFTNAEFQVAMMNGDKLESFYTTPYNGHEGFADELKAEYEQNSEDWHEDDIQYLKDIGILPEDEEEDEE
ncbi:MAG: hypothetical protein PHD20_02835 [Clostridia bacterium]|nr:hypothetical protein [Clostridia bacterium]